MKKHIAIGSFLLTAALLSAGAAFNTENSKKIREDISVTDFTEKLSAKLGTEDRSSYFDKLTISKYEYYQDISCMLMKGEI